MVLKTCLLLLLTVTPVCAQERNAPACDTAQAKAFDFLLGEWRAADGPGQMCIEKILRGCAMRETWRDERGEALLLRSFDATRQKWFSLFLMDDRLVHQSWEGRSRSGPMALLPRMGVGWADHPFTHLLEPAGERRL